MIAGDEQFYVSEDMVGNTVVLQFDEVIPHSVAYNRGGSKENNESSATV
jgi:hypothetical protein